MKAGNPYSASGGPREPARDGAKDTAKAGRSDAAGADKPRFDFYKILPGVEEPKVQAKAARRAPRTAPPSIAPLHPTRPLRRWTSVRHPPRKRRRNPAERYWLQAGSFANEADAENLKARLAFAGWEAAIQPASMPDKAVRFRVRLGPYDNTDELNRMKAELAKRGFDVAVIKF